MFLDLFPLILLLFVGRVGTEPGCTLQESYRYKIPVMLHISRIVGHHVGHSARSRTAGMLCALALQRGRSVTQSAG